MSSKALSQNGVVRVVVGSKNPVKCAAIEGALRQSFPDQRFEFETVAAASGVSDQPMSDAETLNGARGRVQSARKKAPDAHLWAGLEGGIEMRDNDEMMGFAWIVVQSNNATGESRTATFPLPKEIVRLVRSGVELGHANDQVFGRTNSKHKEGAVGTLTAGAIDRQQLYEHAATMALIPLLNQQLFESNFDR